MNTPDGNIKNMTIPWLFQDLRSGKKTGTITFSRDSEVKKIYFRSGEIIYAGSNLETDQLGASLINTGKITREQHSLAAEAARTTGKPLGAVLIDRGFITPKDLVEGAKEQVTRIVCSILPWLEGRYSIDNRPLPAADIIPLQLPTGALLFSGLQSLDWKIIRKSLPSLKTLLSLTKESDALLNGVELDQDQRTVLSFINGSRSIEEICALSEMGDFSTLKAIYVLSAMRLVELSGTKKAESAPAQDSAVAEQTEIKVTKEMIAHALESLEIQDYYQMLDIGRSATTQEIKKAYFRYAKFYHPDRHVDSELSELKEKLEILFTNITEAYNILSKDETRDKYNLALAGGIKRYRTAEQTPANRQDTQKVSAASQFAEGMKQFRVQNFWGAEEAFQWAARLDPTNAEYVFHQGLSLARIPRRRHDAEELFKQALTMAPSKIDYYLELGNFYAKNGLKAKALSLFKDALQRDPSSEKVREALKSVGG